MLDDFQEVARYDLSNRLVPSVRTYGCKLALTFFFCPLLFPAFTPNNPNGYIDQIQKTEEINKHIMHRGGIGHLFSVGQDLIFFLYFFKARYVQIKMSPEFWERGSSYDIYENISLILRPAKIFFVVSVVKMEELCVRIR